MATRKRGASRKKLTGGTVEAHDTRAFPIVGIGASAGGLEAFTALFKALPADTGMAFVLIPHLASSHASSFADILSRATPMPVTEVADEPAVEPNHVYVIPPGREMVIARGTLHLRARDAQSRHRSIDQFFRSLAEDQGHQAIGVILSGTATDGTLGLSAIKAAGGITFAQDDTAQHTSMPHSAIAEGSVDYVLPPHEMAREIVRIARHPHLARDASPAGSDAAGRFEQVLHAVRQGTGVDFTHYKTTTLNRRVTRRMILQKTPSLTDYAQLLRDAPAEVEALHHDLMIGVTSFFRNPEAFEKLKAKVFPKFAAGDRAHDPVRVWVLGCSTGQEAYSLAIALSEYVETLDRRVPVQIFASDLNAAAIEVARTGAYPKDIAEDVSPERLRRFFADVDGHYRVAKSIREMCVFSRHNVLVDPPFSRIDFISCRHLLMYLEPVLQQQVIPILHYALKPAGVLWLGGAETIGAQKDLFDTEDAKHRIFAKKPGVTPHGSLFSLQRQTRPLPEAAPRPFEPREAADVLKESDRLLLARFAPAGVLVSPTMEILQYRGNIAPYVSPVPGKASLNLLKMLGNGLQVAVRGAVMRAKRQGAAVRADAVQVRAKDGSARSVTIDVMPVRGGKGGFLVLFAELDAHDAPRPPRRQPRSRDRKSRPEVSEQQVERLSKELTDTREYLQSVIEQQEAAHEELQSANEEVQSANEELQSVNEELETSKEEIQSSNEELTTLNDELEHRNVQLTRANSDLFNLLASTNQAVVFVGRDLRIRRYTPIAETVLKLISADLGRPIRDIRFKLTIADVEQILTTAMDTLAASEHEVQDEKGRWYSLRVRPYRTLDNTIDGAVMVLVDIDALTRARLYAESIIATVREPLVVLDAEMRVVTASAAFYRKFGAEPRHTEGRRFFDLGNRHWDTPELHQFLEEILPVNDAFSDLEVVRDFEGIGRKALLLNASRIARADGAAPLILLAIEDVTEERHAEGLRRQRVADLAAADQSKNEFLAMLAHELRNPLAPIRTAAQILGMPGVPAPASEKARVIIDRQIQNMTRLIEDLLDVARITQGKIALRMAPVDLIAVLQGAVDVAQRHIGERDQTLSLALPSEPWFVTGDATRLEQAFGNLLRNASKFTPRSGHIWLTAEKPKDDQPGKAVVRVRDDGIGIAPEVAPSVFDMFKQAGHSPHHEPGLGIGLALVQRIVALHNGRVTVRSAGANHGSEFIVSLPLVDETLVQERPQPEVPPIGDVAHRRILVVDDNVDAAESMASLLRLRGHDVRVVHEGGAAVDTAASFLPEIVFLDINMPDMNGYEVARRLRERPEHAEAFIVAVTGFGRDEDRRRANEAGIDRHVTKPLDPAALPALLAGHPRAER